ncbi:cytochrome P450 [Talaromyces proteolyticus]|uniref:Cytochrome P450 n=1 Tax=Talaromyces proteolyticus TaxID=1131652 RepID=A0AAD4PXA3_9EURO|nr:cytochrome P450 [Talaromyces proteolyticus]KAH8693272.1 cytochrome P450 [Talaromyces proteolyticus]
MDFKSLWIPLFIILVLYKFILYPTLFSPLRRLPNAHYTSPFSNLWIKWQRFQGRENKATHAAHVKLGPIVRVGSTEISVNSPELVKQVYCEVLEKDEWYARAFENYGYVLPNMFSMTKKESHAMRKRVLAGLYSKTTLHASPEIRDICRVVVMERLLPIFEKAAQMQRPVDVLEVSVSFSMDFICSYLFGICNGPNFLQDVETRRKWLASHAKTKRYGFWTLEFPNLTALLAKFGIHLVPNVALTAALEVRELCLQLLRNVDSSSSAKTLLLPPKGPGDTPVVYQRLSQSLCASVQEEIYRELPPTRSHLAVASELMDHIKAGTETSGWTLVYLLYEMSRHREIQHLLREELSLLLEPGTSLCFSRESKTPQAAEILPSPRTLDTSPLLQAVILETLRCYPAVAGPQPRVNHNTSFALARHIHLPAGTRVSAQAYSLHRNSEVFPDPESWKPRRWLEATPSQHEEMMRWFWPFGSGSRMCIGNHFAILELKLAVAAIYYNYITEIIDDDGIEPIDGYSHGPTGNKLILQFKRA